MMALFYMTITVVLALAMFGVILFISRFIEKKMGFSDYPVAGSKDDEQRTTDSLGPVIVSFAEYLPEADRGSLTPTYHV